MKLFLLLLVLINYCSADSRVLRPCFERYANHRLVNVMPYHSEWRMKTEDMCLLFCAQSASRCRSVVYDTVQHICHYFSDEGVDQAVISAKMTYLRVVSKSCLQDNSENAESMPVMQTVNTNDVQQELAIPHPPVEDVTTTTESLPEVVTFETVTQSETTTTTALPEIDEVDLDRELKSVMEPSSQVGEDTNGDDNNGVYRDKTPEEQRWMGSMEKMEPSSEKKSIDGKLEDLKIEDKQKYEMLMGVEEDEEKETSLNQLRYGAKVIKFDEHSELRRKPVGKRPVLKPVTISSTSYIQKAKSFLDEVNEADDSDDSGDVITTECRSDDVAVWIAFENSEQSENVDSQADSNVASRKDCQKLCQEKKCRSFTYFEKSRTCHLSTKSDGVSLRAPKAGDFTASTSTKFCYPQTFSVFDGCSNFVAFRDYSVRIEAVEEFDGLPRGYDGMQLCVELCVLSTRYTCRSATFNAVTGKCRLLTEDSLSSPDEFKFDEFQKDLYFENGCTSAGNDQSDVVDRNVEIVAVKPKKLKKKARKAKKLRRRRH